MLQFLAIPVGVQASPTSSGGVVDLNREFGGADARWTWQGDAGRRPITWVAGVSYDRQNELRRGYDNYIGSTLGVQGELRRDENDIATTSMSTPRAPGISRPLVADGGRAAQRRAISSPRITSSRATNGNDSGAPPTAPARRWRA